MATRLTRLVHDGIAAGTVPSHLRPTRVVLLDPYWSPEPKDYLGGKKTGQVTREYIAELLPTGTLFEWYWSSTLTSDPSLADPNDALKPMMMYAAMNPAYITPWIDPTGIKKHCAAYHLYFWSYAFTGPEACTGEGCLGMTKLLSKMSDAQLAAVMRSDHRWTQDGGSTTAMPSDDTYQPAQQADAPYRVTVLQANPMTQTVGGVITVTATVTDINGLAGDGTLVSFATDLGAISARSAVRGGVAIAHIISDTASTAHISATTKGSGGTTQNSVEVTFVAVTTPPPTSTVTPTPTNTPTDTPTAAPTRTPAHTSTSTPTNMPTPTSTATPPSAATNTPTPAWKIYLPVILRNHSS